MNFLVGMYTRMMNKVEDFKENERGSQTLEWIGIAAVVVILVGVISNALGEGSGIGNKVKEKISGLIDKIGG